MKTTLQIDVKLPRIIGFPDVTYGIRNYSSLSHVISNRAQILRPFFNPDRNKEELHPLVIYVIGGGYTVCPPLSQLSTLYKIAEHGYVVASITYPTVNFAPFPAQIEDVKSAIRFFRKNAVKFGIDADRIAIMGESAGGTLASLAGLTGDSGLFVNGDNTDVSDKVSAVIDCYGPTDMAGLGKKVPARFKAARMLLFGLDFCDVPEGEISEIEKSANPLFYNADNAPPFLIMHGTEDKLVSCSDSEKLYKKLTDSKVKTELVLVDGAGHADVRFCQKEVTDKILNFLDTYL